MRSMAEGCVKKGMTSASVCVEPVTSERALARGRYSRSSIAARTRARARPLTWPPLRTRETVLAPTPARAATSAMVAAVVVRIPMILADDSPRSGEESRSRPAVASRDGTGGPAAGAAARDGDVRARRRHVVDERLDL